MKLALVIEQYDPQGGGAERSVRQMAQQLMQRRHAVTLLCARSAMETDHDEDLPIKACFEKGRLTARRMWQFSNWAQTQLKQGSYDTAVSVTTAVAAPILQPRSGTLAQTLARNVALQPTARQRRLKQCFHRLSLKKQVLLKLEARTFHDASVRWIAANSAYVARQVQEGYGLASERVVVIPNAAQMPEVSESVRENWRQTIRRGYRIGADQPVFVFAAMNPKLKGLDPLLQAFACYRLERHMPGVLLLAGKIGGRYMRRAAALGIRESLRFVGATGQMAPLYAAADVTVHPTFYDPSSKVVIESLMMGVPAISTRFNGASDFIVAPGRPPCGQVIDDPADWMSLCRAMCALADPRQRACCAKATQGLADQLSMSRHVDQLEALIARTG